MALWYIRFMKAPRADLSSGLVSTVVRITNDLGNDTYEDAATLTFELHSKGTIVQTFHVTTEPGQFSCKFTKPVKVVPGASYSLLVRAQDNASISAVKSLPFDGKGSSAKFSIRRITPSLVILEELGESIARHVWDAGVCVANQIHESKLPLPPKLDSVVELGAGCGLVGTQIGKSLPQVRSLVLTDLDEAREICCANIKLNSVSAEFKEMDWFSPAPMDADLVILTDCTYNPDAYECLLQTLQCLVSKVAILAHKYRHDAESAFFDLLKEKFVTKERVIGDIHVVYFATNARSLDFLEPQS